MIIYLIPIVILGFMAITNLNIKTKRVYIIFWSFFTIIAMIRYGIGTDYFLYQSIFNMNIQGVAKHLVGSPYFFLTQLINKLGGNYQWIIIISSLFLSITIYFIFSYLLEGRNLYFALYMYVCCGMYFSSYNIFRQYISISFCILSILFFYKNKYFNFIVFFLMGLLFHTSAVTLLPYFLLVPLFKKDSKKIVFFVVFLLLLSFCIMLFNIQEIISFFEPLLPQKYTNYVNNPKFQVYFLNRNISAILKLIIPDVTLLLLLYRNRILMSFKNGKEILLGLALYCFFNNIFYGVVVLTRLTEYYFLFLILGTAYLIETYKNNYNRRLVTIVYVSYYFILCTVTIFIMNGNDVVPYQSYLFP